MITIDGSYLEGGGQIVRTAIALSTLTGIPIKITDIRKGRDNPGLKPQHVHAINALQQLCNAKVAGAHEKSNELMFIPAKLKPKNLEIDIGTAGSITLLLQAVLPVLVFSPKKTRMTITGGTDVHWSPTADYLAHILLPQLEQYATFDFSIKKRGFYPKGSGTCTLTVTPRFPQQQPFDPTHFKNMPRLKLTMQGQLLRIAGTAISSQTLIDAEVSERMIHAASTILKRLAAPLTLRAEYAPTLSTGCSFTLSAYFSNHGDELTPQHRRILGSDTLGEKNITAEHIGEQTAKKLLALIDSGAAVDEHAADNLIPFMGLLPGSALRTSTITNHIKTNIFVVEKFLPCTFKIEGTIIQALPT